METCYCNSSKKFEVCCQPLIEGQQEARSPEELMRSRYSAFCCKNMDYIVETTDPQTRFEMDIAGTQEWMNNSQFTKLEVLNSSEQGNKGVVEFKAYYEMKGHAPEVHHEISKFRKQGGVWYFRDGKIVAPEKTS